MFSCLPASFSVTQMGTITMIRHTFDIGSPCVPQDHEGAVHDRTNIACFGNIPGRGRDFTDLLFLWKMYGSLNRFVVTVQMCTLKAMLTSNKARATLPFNKAPGQLLYTKRFRKICVKIHICTPLCSANGSITVLFLTVSGF